MVTVNVVVLAGSVAAEPVERRMPSGDEVTELDLLLDAYTIVNLSAGLEWERWSATLYVHNVGDENANLSFDRERGGRARLSFRTNEPRTVGVVVRANFGN